MRCFRGDGFGLGCRGWGILDWRAETSMPFLKTQHDRLTRLHREVLWWSAELEGLEMYESTVCGSRSSVTSTYFDLRRQLCYAAWHQSRFVTEAGRPCRMEEVPELIGLRYTSKCHNQRRRRKSIVSTTIRDKAERCEDFGILSSPTPFYICHKVGIMQNACKTN